MSKYEKHEFNFFPTIQGNELKESISKGYDPLFPIMLFEDKVLDGYNRYLICKELKIEPTYKKFEGSRDEALRYSINANKNRRHMDSSMLGGIAALATPIINKLKEEAEKRKLSSLKKGDENSRSRINSGTGNDGEATEQLADLFNTNEKYVRDSIKLGKTDPELLDEVVTGELNINDAVKLSKKTKNQQKKAKEKVKSKECKNVKDAINQVEKEEVKEKLEEIKINNIKLPDFVKIELGDCLELSKTLKDNSISLIVTDPPYPEEYIDCWSKLGKIAYRTLEPSGFCIAYSGHMHLPEVIKRLENEGLVYYWQMILLHAGASATVHPRSMMTGYKPILIFQKPPFKKTKNYIKDIIKGSGKEKDKHEWQQGESELKQIFDSFYVGGIVLEPFAGSGTTLSYCKTNGIKCVGYELDELSYKICLDRLGE